jgi:hypothetical protein
MATGMYPFPIASDGRAPPSPELPVETDDRVKTLRVPRSPKRQLIGGGG